jgi:hypothetical protein
MTNEDGTLRAIIESAASKRPGELPTDLDMKLPADVRATIARGEAAFKTQKKRRLSKRDAALRANSAGTDPAGTAVINQEVHDRREFVLKKKAEQSQGKRGQPPMLERLRVCRIIVDRFLAEGVPFATGRNSKMNKLVGTWLNKMAATSRDTRKSRFKEISADAVRDILRQIKALED